MTIDDGKLLLEKMQESGFVGTKWEQDFVKSIEGWVEAGRNPTDKQDLPVAS